MSIALTIFGASGVLLIVLGSLYMAEDRRGDRVILTGFRTLLDRGVAWLGAAFQNAYRFVLNGVTRFILRHGVYRLLGSVVNYLVQLEQKVERRLLHTHRSSQPTERQRTHLDEIAEHQQENALTEEERQRMKG